MIFILVLVLFSFFYTDKVMNFINKKDPLMKEIDSLKDNYKVLPVNAILEDNTIIPGVKGKEVNIDKSYDNMKMSGIFREDYLVYNDLLPSDMLSNNMDKYIIKGSNSSNRVSIILLGDSNNIDKINKDNITVFLNHKDISIDNIKRLDKVSVYTYGNNGIYSDEILDNDNTIINRVSHNKSIYCLSKVKNNDILNVCNKNNMYVVIPNIIGNYTDIKNNLSNGSIIFTNDIGNLDIIIKYINGKGYKIVSLDNLLTE